MQRRPAWTGFYFDGRTADRQPVGVSVEPDGLLIHKPDGTIVAWPFDAIRQTQGAFVSEQVRIEHGTEPAEVLLVSQPWFADEIRRASPAARRALRSRYNTVRIVAWCVGIMVGAAALYAWGAPIAATRLAERVPVTWEVAMGTSVVERLAPRDSLCADPYVAAQLDTVLRRLTAAAPVSGYDFRMRVVRDTVVNAFAAPGGFIAVNSGLLAATSTPEEFAGVLAHEMQHVTHRHSTRALIREAPLRYVMSSMSGGGVEAAANIIGTLGALRYRRDDEAEADREGLRLLQAAHVDATGMVTFMRSLEKRGEPGSTPRMVNYLSTHPRTADRVAELERLTTQDNARPIMDAAAWQRVRTGCAVKR